MSVLHYQNVKRTSAKKVPKKNHGIILLMISVGAAAIVIGCNINKLGIDTPNQRAAVHQEEIDPVVIPDMVPGVCTVQGLRIRRNPSVKTDLLGLLDENELVKITAVSTVTLTVDGMTGPWLQIELVDGDYSGWVFSGYIAADKDQLKLLAKKVNIEKPAAPAVEDLPEVQQIKASVSFINNKFTANQIKVMPE